FLEPAILTGRSSLPTKTFVASPEKSWEQPVTSGRVLPGVAQVSSGQTEPTTPADELTTASIEATGKEPKKEARGKEPKKNVARKIGDRPVHQAIARRSTTWNFSSSPASPDFR